MPPSTDRDVAGEQVEKKSLVQWLIRLRSRHAILRNASWTLSAHGLQMAGRFAYFVIIAHVLGPSGYGTFIACTALLATMSPFASFGADNVLVKYVARDRSSLPHYFGNALFVTCVASLSLALLAYLIRPWVLPTSATASLLITIAVADLLARPIVSVCLNAFAATGQFHLYTQLASWTTGARVIAAIVLALMHASVATWAQLYAGATVLAAVTGVAVVIWRCDFPRFRPGLVFPSMREGFHFSTSAASQSIYNDIDKTMLARISGVDAAAIYGVAYRFVDAAMLPIIAVAAASYPEFFRHGAGGIRSSFAFAKKIIRRSALYGLIVSIVLFFSADLVPVVMGKAYAEGAIALRYLCLLPVIKSVHAFLTDTLTGADHQTTRSFVQIGIAVFNVLLNLWIIRAFAWRGAAVSSLTTDLLLAILLYLIIRHIHRREIAGEAAQPGQTALAPDQQ